MLLFAPHDSATAMTVPKVNPPILPFIFLLDLKFRLKRADYSPNTFSSSHTLTNFSCALCNPSRLASTTVCGAEATNFSLFSILDSFVISFSSLVFCYRSRMITALMSTPSSGTNASKFSLTSRAAFSILASQNSICSHLASSAM